MGLDTTHDCWHGAYSAFGRWREKIAEVAGLPPLGLMEGFYTRLADGIGKAYPTLPIKWEWLKPDPLHILLNHSDCDGEIDWRDCPSIADRLEELLPLLPEGNLAHIENWRNRTTAFIKGLREAYNKRENVEFH